MVSITPQLLKLYVISLFYPSRRLGDDLHHFFIQQRFPLLHRKYGVVMYLPGAMASFLDTVFVHPC